ncbi:MAG TPA: carboxymuconolactone decarboxylase family protein [Amycolatopsis sp.]|nr:carboxymuconolactone decarboxylase family protein [Amycolatopsis sp.]
MAPHRLSPRSSKTTTGDVQRVLAKLEASGRDLPIIKAVANWSAGFRPFVLMADALLANGSLPPVVREIAVLHIAAAQGLEYEWQEHAPMAERAGVSPAQLEALRDGGLPRGGPFDEDQLLALTAVHQLLDHGEFTGETWERLCERFGEDAALELIFVMAWWGGFVPVTVKALFPLITDGE